MVVSQNSWLCREASWSIKTAGVGREVCLWVNQLWKVCFYVGGSKQLG